MARRNSVANGHATAKRCYKDTVFRMLFADKENLLSLYNAINKRTYNNPNDLEIVTLENAIYMEMKNDLAFIVDTNLCLYEHQSTFNPNIPLRDLFYISCEYQELVNDRTLYSPRLRRIPAPKFIVFYNGRQEREDISELRLSDAFEGSAEEANMELKVKMLNINAGHNQELMEQCKILWEYAQYVAKVREYTRTGIELDEAVERAVDECIKAGVLSQFLSENRAEVISVSIFEYDKEEEEKKLRREEFDAGEKAGIARERRAIIARMHEKGYSNKQIADLMGIPTEQVQLSEEKLSAAPTFDIDRGAASRL